jgi:hypothetical protein
MTAELKRIRKLAARMFLVRSGWKSVKTGWKVVFLIEQYGYDETLAKKIAGNGVCGNAHAPYKHFLKFQKFAMGGVQVSEIKDSHKNHRRGK